MWISFFFRQLRFIGTLVGHLAKKEYLKCSQIEDFSGCNRGSESGEDNGFVAGRRCSGAERWMTYNLVDGNFTLVHELRTLNEREMSINFHLCLHHSLEESLIIAEGV